MYFLILSVSMYMFPSAFRATRLFKIHIPQCNTIWNMAQLYGAFGPYASKGETDEAL